MAQNADQNDGKQTGSETPPADGFDSFDDYLATQPDSVRELYDAHFTAKTAGLKSALDAERDRAKTAEKQYRELAKTADPETAERLRQLADQTKAEADALKAQIDFTTDAVKLGCRAVDKAWLIAQATGQTAEQLKADPDWSALFGAPPAKPDARAGAGTGGEPAGKQMTPSQRMDALIRAGRSGGVVNLS